VVATLNFVEEARKRGIDVSADQLAALLGIPVFSINPLRKTGIGQLAHAALTAPTGHGFTVTYDDHIEQAIKMVEGALPDDLPFSKRFVAICTIRESLSRWPRRFLSIRTCKKISLSIVTVSPPISHDWLQPSRREKNPQVGGRAWIGYSLAQRGEWL
jgi:Fe2+ transport system protein B